MKPAKNHSLEEVEKIISHERERTNILKASEQKTIAFLVLRIPSWISSDMLTGIGFFGSIVIFLSFVSAHFLGAEYLLFGILGFIINWFGDSLDGRIAYFRNKPRKWYGFSLDLTSDWIGTIMMGLGFMIYVEGTAKFLGFVFVVLYGWEIMTTLIRYKITGIYSIDSGILGPTEARIIISAMLLLEVLLVGSINYFAVAICMLLFATNIIDFFRLLRQANVLDKKERERVRAQ